MEFDFRALSAPDRYKLMTATITPRPIAWVSSLSTEGIGNAAPFSFFNMMGDDPPIIALGFLARHNGGLKDSAANILDTGEFVVNLVPETLGEAMSLTSGDAPAEQDELALAGLSTIKSTAVGPPRIAGCPVAFECHRLDTVWSSPSQLMIVGEVIVAHIADAALIEDSNLHVDVTALGLIARMHGRDWYSRQTDLFQVTRPV